MKKYWSILLFSFSFITYSGGAEVYRWVDDDGNVYFSDKKPAKNDVEDISEKISITNIDESSEAMQRLDRVLSESEGEIQIRGKREQKKLLEQKQLNSVCERAQNELRILRGRVVFVDEKGESYNISEKQRKIRAAKLEAEIKLRCT